MDENKNPLPKEPPKERPPVDPKLKRGVWFGLGVTLLAILGLWALYALFTMD